MRVRAGSGRRRACTAARRAWPGRRPVATTVQPRGPVVTRAGRPSTWACRSCTSGRPLTSARAAVGATAGRSGGTPTPAARKARSYTSTCRRSASNATVISLPGVSAPGPAAGSPGGSATERPGHGARSAPAGATGTTEAPWTTEAPVEGVPGLWEGGEGAAELGAGAAGAAGSAAASRRARSTARPMRAPAPRA